jgi:hypothetical protein
MDTAGVERVDFNALGGADLVTVNDLTGTDVDAVNIELAGALGGITGDGAADNVVVNATNGVDTIFVEGDADTLKVIGLAAAVQILRSEFANGRLDINTLAGNDRVDVDGLQIGAIKLSVDGLLVPIEHCSRRQGAHTWALCRSEGVVRDHWRIGTHSETQSFAGNGQNSRGHARGLRV